MNKTLLARPANGLGNRLRNVASSYILATGLERDFYLDWPLFSSFWERSFPAWSSTTVSHLQESAGTYGQLSLARPLTIAEIEEDPSPNLILQGGQSFSPTHMTLGTYNGLKADFYNTLAPKPFISRAVESFVDSHFKGEKVLGVQLRGGDLGVGRLGVCLSPEESFPFIDDHINEYDVIFLTTSEPEWVTLAKKRYPHANIVTYPRNSLARRDGGTFWQNPRKKDIMKEDLIEWYILGEVDFLIFSHESSFGYESLFLNRRTEALELINPRKKSFTWKNNHRALVYDNKP